MDVIIGFLLPQMPVHARYEVKIFADGVCAIAANRADQIRAKHAEGSGNNRQHVSLAPRFPANQKRPKVLDHLDDFDALARKPHSLQVSLRDLRPIQHANDSANGHHALRVREHRQHDAQQRVALQDGIRVNDTHVGRSRHIHSRIHRVRFASSRLFVNHQQPAICAAAVEPPYGCTLHFGDINWTDQPQAKLLAYLVEGAILRSVVDYDKFQFRIIDLQQISYPYASATFSILAVL